MSPLSMRLMRPDLRTNSKGYVFGLCTSSNNGTLSDKKTNVKESLNIFTCLAWNKLCVLPYIGLNVCKHVRTAGGGCSQTPGASPHQSKQRGASKLETTSCFLHLNLALVFLHPHSASLAQPSCFRRPQQQERVLCP